MPLEFNSTPEPYVGVELELQLLDAETLALAGMAPAVLADVPPEMGPRIKPEFLACMVELNTAVCKDVKEAEGDLRESLALLEEILARHGGVFFSASLHPFSEAGKQRVSNHPRYKRIMEELQLIGRRFIAQGLHVHVGVADRENAIKIFNAMRLYVPILLALTTSSPYYQGEDTGLFSYRTKLFEALPLAGMPDSLSTWEEFDRMAGLLLAGGVITSVKDLWWDVRPHPEFGTVEVRCADMPLKFRDIMTLVALIQALVVTIDREEFYPDVNMQVLKSNKWQAARYGLDGAFVDPRSGKRYALRAAAEELSDIMRPAARLLGSEAYLEGVGRILAEGTGAHALRELYGRTGDFREVVRLAREEFEA
ncbi:MAG: YbdK family carboxylate-amine ligase [Nitrospirota bacterium]